MMKKENSTIKKKLKFNFNNSIKEKKAVFAYEISNVLEKNIYSILAENYPGEEYYSRTESNYPGRKYFSNNHEDYGEIFHEFMNSTVPEWRDLLEYCYSKEFIFNMNIFKNNYWF